MGDLKPLGSEKLSGDDKLKRILELTYYNSSKKPNSSNKPETIKESINGVVYGIVKEKDGYYVKKGINESSLDYIGGLFMKNKNRFSSYSEALKRMELLSGQESLQEATKYVLKSKSEGGAAPSPEGSDMTPAPEGGDMPPSPEGSDMPPAPEGGDMPPAPEGGDTPPSPEGSDMPPAPEGGETPNEMGGEGKRSDYMSEIQKFSGKLGQELRDQGEKLQSDDIKYVLNMIISAVDLDKLEDEDIEEIGKKFEREELEEPSSEGESQSEPSSEPSTEPENELGEIMSKLNDFIGEKAPQETDEIDLSKYADLGTQNEEDIQELDLDEIKNEINKSIGETLSKYFK